jgi:signal transduction histidine kinase
VERLFRDFERGDVRHYEMELTGKSGEKRTVSWTSINRCDERGELTEIVGFGIDVTDQRRVERLMRVQRDLGLALSAETDLTAALEACLSAALSVAELDCGGIYLMNEQGGAELAVHAGLSAEFVQCHAPLDDEQLRRKLIDQGDPVYLSMHEVAESVRDFIASASFRVVAILPVRHEGRTIACLVTASCERDRIAPTAREALEGIAAQIGTAIARLRAEEKLREEQQLLRQVLDLQERERRLIAYEIHDGLAQQLTGGLMQLQALRHLSDRQGERAERDLDALQHILSDGLVEARRLIAGLRPMILDELGVVAAIDHLIHETQERDSLEVEFVHEEDLRRLVPPLETAVFRVVQEALNNARRHSQSESVLVQLTVRGDRVRVAVEDWGVGFEPSRVQENRFGLRGIRERARLLGGRVHIDSAPGLGTCVVVDFPLITDNPDE